LTRRAPWPRLLVTPPPLPTVGAETTVCAIPAPQADAAGLLEGSPP
jgi:hypothetical protein